MWNRIMKIYISKHNRILLKGVTHGWLGHKTYNNVHNNKDNSISNNELIEHLCNKYKSYDTNNNELISPGELLDGIIKDINKIKKISKNIEN